MRKICVVGLGYVGLSLAVEFGKKQKVFGFDICEKRIKELMNNFDSKGEFSEKELSEADIVFSNDAKVIGESDFIIVAVPTPIDLAKKPDLSLLKEASGLIGKFLKKGSIVVYESTVYPGVTENVCRSILEKESGLKCGIDFKIGYSPERINPGDRKHSLKNVVKIVSGMDSETLKIIYDVYSSIVEAGVFKAKSIKIAEAAKVIENVQRDINIALVNELKMIFDKMEIDIHAVLEAASTKWNFLKFTPGLVGGHCIGVDPFYLAFEAERIGHHPEIILAGRRINDNMAKYEASRIIKKLIDRAFPIKGLKILILGATFKPNVRDLRNSKVQVLADELKEFGCDIKICDPNINKNKIFSYDNISIEQALEEGFAVAIYAVKHDIFEKQINEIKAKFRLFLHLLK